MGRISTLRARRARNATAIIGYPLTGLAFVVACSSTSAPPGTLGNTSGDAGLGLGNGSSGSRSSSGGGSSSGGVVSSSGGALDDAATDAHAEGSASCGDSGQVMCDGICTDLMNDSNNCGGCTQPCGTGFTCSGGKCACGGDTPTQCGLQCVNISNDPANCGGCGHNCEGNQCMNNLCAPSSVAAASGGYLVGYICANSTEIFWTSPNTATALGGVTGQSFANLAGSPTTYTISNINTEPGPAGVAADINNLYWVDTVGRVVEYDLTTGGRHFWSNGDGGISNVPIESPVDIAIDSTNMYWVDNQAGTVDQAAKTPGSPVIVIASNRLNPRSVTTDGVNVYWIDYGDNTSDGSVNAVPVGGGTITPIATGLDQPWDIVTDGTRVYWTENSNPGSVKSAPIGGGVAPTVLASAQAAPEGIALDPAMVQGQPVSPRYLYWTNYDGQTVSKAPADGSGTPFILATSQNSPAEMFVDTDRNVFWAGGSVIYKVAQ